MLLFIFLLFPFLIIVLLLMNLYFYNNKRINIQVYKRYGQTMFIVTILWTIFEIILIGIAGEGIEESLYILFLYVVKYILVAIAQIVAIGYSILQWRNKAEAQS